jgi:tetratricopeptide (TPR) repeat protein
MLAQINSLRGAIFIFALALTLSGCTPAGPRALLKGKKCLDRGDVAAAVTQLKRATTLMATNANAWNYLGVALHRAGLPDEAAIAYENALKFDHDLVEAHYNLGLLELEQSRADLARNELTAYTLRRPNDAAGWLKLGFAQLKSGEILPAERSFSTVLSLKTDEAAAYNGLGMARIQAGKSREAAQFFAAALQARPDFAPALLNLATVNLQYFHDSKAALANYEAYLALKPRPAEYDEVKAITAGLAQSDVASTVMAPAVIIRTSAPPSVPEPKPRIVITAPPHPAPTPAARIQPDNAEPGHATSRYVPETTPATSPAYTYHPAPAPPATEPVRVTPLPQNGAGPKTNHFIRPQTVAAGKAASNVAAAQEPLEVPMPDEEPPKHGFWHRLFAGDKSATVAKAPSHFEENVTPIPVTTEEDMAGTKPEEKPAGPKPEPAPAINRYTYTAPAKPAPGDRQAAEGLFNQARRAEQDANWDDAEGFYKNAADTDPSWFEAQYNAGVIAHRLHNYTVALPRYELALALQPESVDARYNFALALKSAGYPQDAADQLRKILAANPDEVRAHLALANLCAQSLREPAEARQHYLRVLELQPDNPQAQDIRYWLSANSK